MRPLVMIVEDEALLARNMATYLGRRDYEVVVADTVRRARALWDEARPDAVLIDHNLPDGTGLDLLAGFRRADRGVKLVMITAHGSVEMAVAAMKAGADDYLTKPIRLDELALLLEKLSAQARLEGSLSYFRAREERRSGLDRILGASAPMAAMKERISRLLDADRALGEGVAGAPVLILGETGTGKELVARALHFDGPRRERPFVDVNCAALPDQLVESELFGHERGAFTDAKERKVGLFQAADGGTLFLDEVGELPLQTQAKLLRALEDRTIRPVGSLRDRRVDVRLIAATNATLEEKVRQGEFRGDLYYRLATVTVTTPPLRARGDDVRMIAETLLGEFSARYGRSGLAFGDDAVAALLAHPWPGNVRELRNVVEQACLLTVGAQIRASDLTLRPLPSITTEDRPAAGASLGDVERDLIVAALHKAGGNVTEAARALGVSRDTLRYRIEKHGRRRDG